MVDLPPRPDTPDAPTPRWVKRFGLVALALLLVFLVVHLAGGGLGHHMSGGHAPPAHDPHGPGHP
jgi:hypothetical protein